jgi:fatty aldehyde-generating acyl-ACP reductase
VRNIELDFGRFTTGNTHTAYVICTQVETLAEKMGIDLAQSTVVVCWRIWRYLAALFVVG